MTTTTNLADFGRRELAMTRDLLDAMLTQGLPNDFDDSGVTVMLNQYSGEVFLTNEEYQVAMLNGDKLESCYISPYESKEGFFDELLAEYDDMHSDDKEWFRDVAEAIGREEALPQDENE